MEPLILKTNVREPIRLQLGAYEGTTYVPYAIPLAAEVWIAWKGTDGTTHASRTACTIEDRNTGIVSYGRSGPENAISGKYHAEFQVIEGSTLLRVFPEGEPDDVDYIPVTLNPTL